MKCIIELGRTMPHSTASSADSPPAMSSGMQMDKVSKKEMAKSARLKKCTESSHCRNPSRTDLSRRCAARHVQLHTAVKKTRKKAAEPAEYECNIIAVKTLCRTTRPRQLTRHVQPHVVTAKN